MKDSKHNIKFNYLYRDVGNYKIFGDVVFYNQEKIDLGKIEKEIRTVLIDGEFFYPVEWKILALTFDEGDEIFPAWNEFENIEFTNKPPTDKRTFIEFINELNGIENYKKTKKENQL
jgi:hypothetical protein